VKSGTPEAEVGEDESAGSCVRTSDEAPLVSSGEAFFLKRRLSQKLLVFVPYCLDVYAVPRNDR